MKIYISGPISGRPIKEAEEHFAKAFGSLLFDYHSPKHPVNPMKIKPFLGLKNWYCYMITDVWALLKCDAIYMLKGWDQSRGARIEKRIAEWLKMEVLFEI